MITGELLIGQHAVRGAQGVIHGCNPATGEQLQPAFGLADEAQLQRACALADAAFDTFRDLPPLRRAAFLEAIAQGILDLGDRLLEQAQAETGLPRARLEGERGRTVGQLRLFAGVLREGSWQE
ncbi:aldehyde dehydrogenase family protein, partial [Oxalobacteraceae bacterium OM1]